MKARSMMLVLAGSVALAPLAMAQDHAVPRGGGGGGGGGGSSSGGSQPAVHSSGGGSSSSSGGSSGGYYGGSSSSGSSSRSTAERRHPRAGTGRGYYGGGGGGYYYPGYYGGYYYPGFYGSYWWPYGAYGWYGGYWGYPWGWGWGGGGPTYHYVQREAGAVRVLVDPSEARVYVDGYYAGTVDDFDGLFQRLNVAPGRHEVTLKLEGYKTHRMRVYVSPEHTLKLHYTMQKGSGESFEDLAANVPESQIQRDRERERERDREQEQHWSERERSEHDEDLGGPAGRLRLNVRPSDASVYVDGAFRGDGREASSLRLPPGRHRIEVVRPGYRTVEREVEVTAGQSTDLSIDLEKGSI
jgi:hypothetical protein